MLKYKAYPSIFPATVLLRRGASGLSARPTRAHCVLAPEGGGVVGAVRMRDGALCASAGVRATAVETHAGTERSSCEYARPLTCIYFIWTFLSLSLASLLAQERGDVGMCIFATADTY